MNDLISRQTALTEIRKDGKWLEEQGVTSMTTHERELRDTFILREMPSVGKAANTITFELSTEQIKKCVEKAIVDIVPFEQQWIPCSERLPEEDGVYIVTTSKGQVQQHVFDTKGNSKEYWMRCNKAWMPLPEPYKGES